MNQFVRGPGDALDRSRCQVGGLNQNYTSTAGTLYHIQVEDLGPVLDRVTEEDVRRVNVIVYANYGEPNARIIHGRDVDFPDVRTHQHNLFIQARIPEVAAEAREVIESKERWQVARIKAAIREYHRTKSDVAKRYFEDANGLFPFLFSRAWRELKDEKGVPPSLEALESEEVVYPLDSDLRERVLDIERLIEEIGQDLQRLRDAGGADDILVRTCRKLVARARIKLNEYPRALADYDVAIKIEPGDAYGFTARGNAKLDSGNPEGALADYNEALRIKPDYAFARENRAYAYFNTGDYNRAVEELTFAINNEPTALLHVRRGHAYAMLEDRDRELADYSQAVTRDPGFIEAYRRRADAYFARHDFDRAIADLSKVIELAPDDPRFWHARAAAYKLMNDVDKATADQNEAKQRERAKFLRLIETR